MELYGLVSFVDEHVFGSEEAFRELYAKKSEEPARPVRLRICVLDSPASASGRSGSRSPNT